MPSPAAVAPAGDPSLPKVLVNASSLVGSTVRDSAGREIGEIKELMVDTASRQVTYAVLASGGFLGVGQTLFAVPFESLTVSQGKNAIVLNARGEVLPAAPGFQGDRWPNMGDPSFQERVRAYWQDASITAAVKWKLATERIGSLTSIDVTTTQGAVSLSGSVDSDDTKKSAEDVARRVAGVRRVDNNLEVRN
jgi:sporulation protein YlmC with PRC-barrel domain